MSTVVGATAGALATAAPSAPAPALDAILLLEQPLAHLPYDQLKNLLHTQQRLIQRELDLAQTNLLTLAQQQSAQPLDPATVAAQIDGSVKRLKALKRRLAQLNAHTKTTLSTASSRYAHLNDLHAITSTADPAFQHWSRTRLQRILVDYMLRHGATKAAAHLTSSAAIPTLVDTSLFAEIDKIEASLYPNFAPAAAATTSNNPPPDGHCGRALAWCAENRPGLEAIGSRLEFDLRMQVYIELARTRTPQSLREAITYLRTHLLPMQQHHHQPGTQASADTSKMELDSDDRIDDDDEDNNNNNNGEDGLERHFRRRNAGGDRPTSSATSVPSRKKQISRALGLLACPPGSPAYADLYHIDRWASLRAQFRSCALLVHSLPPQPMLHIALSAGLSSLKVPQCYAEEQDMMQEAEMIQHEKRRRRRRAREREEGGNDTGTGGSSTAEGISATGQAVDRAMELSGRSAIEVSIPASSTLAGPGASSTVMDLSASTSSLMSASTTSSASFSVAGGGPTPSAFGLAQMGAKTPLAGTDHTQRQHKHGLAKRNPDCPICERSGLGMLAKEVPWSHHENSTIVCRLGGHVMSDDDPPMCLPNGRVYSQSALEELALQSPDGTTVVDPDTGDAFPFASLRKMYIS
ncbi:GID complex subunit containing RING finger motif [Tilletia horrida]|uniref:GID complex subunit containing RING finger motif n=1 Tax=Tilletia horrida TaxID=155126 RepID=A0AAN6GNV8_9BASI|nr:GID complex subunit containing RING finger motif [Tilletia horrida]KAK0564678.1 GID complex subunit containing RING finger motif [Tilletia horrida]